jgi:hypothetical protein
VSRTNSHPFLTHCERNCTLESKQRTQSRRRLFLGANIATEPWEVIEVIGTEGYGLFSGIVYVEGNRTQNFTPRRVRRLQHGPILAQIFGVPTSSVQVRLHVNEDEHSRGLVRENIQRLDIVRGWKELGMTRDDVGIVADVDETFSRDFMLAMQHCDGIKTLEYDIALKALPMKRCIHRHRAWAEVTFKKRAMAAIAIFPSSTRLPTIAIRRGGPPTFATAADRKRTWPNRGAVPTPRRKWPFICTIFLPNSIPRALNMKRMHMPFTIKPGAKFSTCTET